MKSLILFLAFTAVCYAGDYKVCIIEYKTDAELCQGIADSLNVKVPKIFAHSTPPDIEGELWIEIPYDSVWYSPKGDTVYRESGVRIREFRGLAFESVPEWDNTLILRIQSKGWKDSLRKAVLIYEEVDR